jgi:hypothetical protein
MHMLARWDLYALARALSVLGKAMLFLTQDTVPAA